MWLYNHYIFWASACTRAVFLLLFSLNAPLTAVCHQSILVTTCKHPPALSSPVLLPSTNVTWMSDCANAGTSLGFREAAPDPALRGDESCQWPRPAGWCGHCPSSPGLLWSSTATSQLLADWSLSGEAGRQAGWQSSPGYSESSGSHVGWALLPCAVWNEVILRTGICVATFQSPNNLQVHQKKSRLNVFIFYISLFHSIFILKMTNKLHKHNAIKTFWGHIVITAEPSEKDHDNLHNNWLLSDSVVRQGWLRIHRYFIRERLRTRSPLTSLSLWL